MTERTPVGFVDLDPSRFPFRIECVAESGAVVYAVDVPGPGAVRIPGLAAEHGPISVRITWPNGEATGFAPTTPNAEPG